MSANIYCWLPALGLLPNSSDFNQRIEAIQESQAVKPIPAIVEFVGTLTKRYPELTKGHTDTAWADGPLLGDANGQFINIGIQFDKYGEAAPFVVLTARRFGLNCYDPQNAHYYSAKGPQP